MENEKIEPIEYFESKKPDKIYVSRVFERMHPVSGEKSRMRKVSKVIDSEKFYDYLKKGKHVILRETNSERQEIIAWVNEDTKKFSVSIQRFEKKTGMPHKATSFSFFGGALNKFYEFLKSLEYIDFSDKENFRIEDEEIKKTIEIKRFLTENPNINFLLKSLPKDASANFAAIIRQTNNKNEIKNLEKLLDLENSDDFVDLVSKDSGLKNFVGGKAETIFQHWLEKNLWVLGVEYIKKHDKSRIGLFSDADLIMETTDGFIDLIELKRSQFDLLKYDPNHKCYSPSSKLAEAIGQSLFYLQKLDEYKSNIEKEYSTKVLKPRVRIIAGRSNGFNNQQLEAMRMLNSNLNHIHIIPYDYLLDWGNKIISHYES